MRSLFIAATVMALSTLAVRAMAAPIDPINPRPALIEVGPAGEPTLQQILTSGPTPVFVNSTLDVSTDQSPWGLFNAIGSGPINLLPTLASENNASAGTQTFGIWFGSDSANLLRVDLLLGGAVVGDAAALTLSGGQLNVGAGTGACGIAISCQTLNDARIGSSAFGFYFHERDAAPIYHSIDALNASTIKTRVLAFNDKGSEWAFGYEDYRDFDYQDMVVKIGNISAVPEPAAIGLALVGGLVAFGLRRRPTPGAGPATPA